MSLNLILYLFHFFFYVRKYCIRSSTVWSTAHWKCSIRHSSIRLGPSSSSIWEATAAVCSPTPICSTSPSSERRPNSDNNRNDANNGDKTFCPVCVNKTPTFTKKVLGGGNFLWCLVGFAFVGPFSILAICMDNFNDVELRCTRCM